jgi:hypothetical protein
VTTFWSVGIGIHRELRELLRLDASDVRFVDAGMDLHVFEPVRHRERRTGFQAHREGLPLVDEPSDDHAVDRRPDDRAIKVGLRGPEDGLLLRDSRLCLFQFGFDPAQLRFRTVQRIRIQRHQHLGLPFLGGFGS